MRVGWISISLGVTATPAAVEDRPRGLTTISWVETCAPVADSDTKHGRYASTAAEVVATCAGRARRAQHDMLDTAHHTMGYIGVLGALLDAADDATPSAAAWRLYRL
jgi:hypothetical protein